MQKLEHPLLSPRNFWSASAYLVLLGVLSAELVEINKAYEWVPARYLVLTLLFVVAIGGYRLVDRLRRAWNRGGEIIKIDFGKVGEVREATSLIALVSQREGRSSALQAVQYHAGRNVLRHLSLITTHEAEGDAIWVREQVQSNYPNVTVHDIHFLEDKDNIPETKGIVEHLRSRSIKEFKVPEADLICDFTGLTKNASAGMILACATRTARLQYMVPNRRGPDGRADPVAGSLPCEVFLKYVVVEDT
jgi:hypothetical protein